jgi:hypothetical protein
MKKYEYTGMDVSTSKSVEDGASYYIEAVRRYLESEKFPHVETIAAILGLKEVEVQPCGTATKTGEEC